VACQKRICLEKSDTDTAYELPGVSLIPWKHKIVYHDLILSIRKACNIRYRTLQMKAAAGLKRLNGIALVTMHLIPASCQCISG